MNVREGDSAEGVPLKVVYDIQSLTICLGAVEEGQRARRPQGERRISCPFNITF